MRNRKRYILLTVLLLLSNFFIMGASVFATEETDFSNSSLELAIEGKKAWSMTDATQEVKVAMKDTTSFDADLVQLDKIVYAIWFPKGVSFVQTTANVPIETYQDHITFQLTESSVSATFTFRVDSTEMTEASVLRATRSGAGIDIQSNDLVLTPAETSAPEVSGSETESTTEQAETATTSETTDPSTKDSDTASKDDEETASSATSTSIPSKEIEKTNKARSTARALKPDVALENNMQVSNDFADGITVADYLAQYSFPHLPKGGVTAAYQSTEVDLRRFAPSEIALVYDRTTWNAAISNASIKAISVVKSFAMTGAQVNFSGANRQLVIEGNNLLIDFRLTISNFGGANNRITVQNLNMYHANYYGMIRPTASNSLLQFHNISDYGSQMISSQALPVQISGDFVSRFTTAQYISPIDGTSVTTQYATQQNFESSNLEFLADSVTTLETHSGANIDLTAVGDVVLYENAKLNLIAGNKAAGAGEGVSGYGISARYASNFIMKKNSQVSYKYTDPGTGYRNAYGVVYFNNSGTFTMEDGAKMIVNKDSHSGNDGLINFNYGGTFNLEDGSSIEMNVKDASAGAVAVYLRRYGTNYPVFNMTGKSHMSVNFTSTGTGTNPVIDAGSYATFNIDSGSILDIQTTGYKGNIISLDAGSAATKTSFTVGEDAKLNVNAQGRTGTTTDVVNVGNYAAFQIKRLGTFKLSANTARYLFNVGSNSTFQFSDALLVDFGYTEQPAASSALINMSGSAGKFLVDIQRVKAWNRSGTALDDDAPTYDWNPMFGMEIPYSGTTVNNATILGSSTTAGVSESFKQNFNTGPTTGFQRLLFEFIPDVKVKIDNQPVDNPNNANSKIISGQTNAGAFVRLSDTPVSGGYSSFPTSNNTIADPTVGGTQPNYTVKADSTGHFEFEVPTNENIPFVAGTTIHAYAFLNGKSDDTDPIGSADVPEEEWDKIVSDTTAPSATGVEGSFVVNTPLPEAKTFLKDITDTNPNTTITASYKDSEETLNGYLSTAGDYDITILLADEAGNTAEIKTKLHVFDSSGKIEGEDIELKTSEIDSMSREEFENQMKADIKATAYILIDNQYKNLDDKISYDFSKVNQAAGVYTVDLTVPKAESGGTELPTKVVTVTIKANGPTAPVDPDNPQEGTLSPEGTENEGTNAIGDLRMDYAPSGITFGIVPFSYTDTTYAATKPLNTNGTAMSKQWIQISDDRTALNGWTVKVSQTEAFTDSEGDKILGTTLKIPKGIINNSLAGTVDTEATDAKMTAQEVQLGVGGTATMFGAKDVGEDSSGKKISTYQWDPTNVTLTVPGGKAKINSAYETELNWTLTTEPVQ